MLPSQLRSGFSAGFDLSVVPGNSLWRYWTLELLSPFKKQMSKCVCVWVAGAGQGGRFFQLLVFLFISFQPGLTWGALTGTDIYVNGNQNSGCLCEEREGRGADRLGKDKKEPCKFFKTHQNTHLRSVHFIVGKGFLRNVKSDKVTDAKILPWIFKPETPKLGPVSSYLEGSAGGWLSAAREGAHG